MFSLPKLSRRPLSNFLPAALLLIFLCLTTLFLKDSDTGIKALQAKDLNFKVCSIYESEKEAITDIASDNIIKLFASLSNGKILSFDTSDNSKEWETDLGGIIISKLLVTDTSVIVTTESLADAADKKHLILLRSLNLFTGLTEWQTEITAIDSELSPDVDFSQKEIYLFNWMDSVILVSRNGSVFTIAKKDGQITLKQNFNVKFSSKPILNKSDLYLGTVNKQLIKYSLNEHRVLETYSIAGIPTVVKFDNERNRIVIGDQKGAIAFTNGRNKISGRFRAGAEISGINVMPEGILISSFDNFIYLISRDSGDLIWKKRLNGRISVNFQLYNDFFLANSVESNEILLLDSRTGRLLNKLFLRENVFLDGEMVRVKDDVFLLTNRGIFKMSADLTGC